MSGLTAPELVLVGLGITEPGEIDLDAIAWTLGVRVKYRPLDGCEARIIGNGDQAIITVNSRSNARRQRFSVGHELGHWQFHRGRLLACHADQIGGVSERQSPQERSADIYAANLLMPNYLLQPLARTYARLTFQAIKEIADQFDTSLTSTAIRLVEGRHSPSILICHGSQGRKWFVRSPEVPDRWFPRRDLDAESFAFDILFGGKPDDRGPRKIGADAWFDRPGADRYDVTEQTMRTAQDEILTLVLVSDDGMLSDCGWR